MTLVPFRNNALISLSMVNRASQKTRRQTQNIISNRSPLICAEDGDAYSGEFPKSNGAISNTASVHSTRESLPLSLHLYHGRKNRYSKPLSCDHLTSRNGSRHRYIATCQILLITCPISRLSSRQPHQRACPYPTTEHLDESRRA